MDDPLTDFTCFSKQISVCILVGFNVQLLFLWQKCGVVHCLHSVSGTENQIFTDQSFISRRQARWSLQLEIWAKADSKGSNPLATSTVLTVFKALIFLYSHSMYNIPIHIQINIQKNQKWDFFIHTCFWQFLASLNQLVRFKNQQHKVCTILINNQPTAKSQL